MNNRPRLSVIQGHTVDDEGQEIVVPDEFIPPAQMGSRAIEQEVFDAEFVEETETQEPTRRHLPITGRVVVVRPAPWVLTVARSVAIHGLTVAQGVQSWTTRAVDALSMGVYRRQIRAAEAMGDQAALVQWVQLAQQAKTQRHLRLMDLPLLAVGLVKFTLITLAGVLVLLLLLSFAVWATGLGSFGAVFTWIGSAIRWVLTVLGAAWTPLIIVVPLVMAWREGRRRATPPRWLLPPSQRVEDLGAPITPSLVVTAMRELGITPLRKAIQAMGDAGAAMLSHIRIAGCGSEVDVYLPQGVSTEEIQKRRRKLAENLGRHEHELFITIPAARVVRLWIADSGALDEPIGPSPLVTDHNLKADYKTGRAPWGQSLRGDPVGISLYQRMLLITGKSNQGKTAALRALVLWLAFTNVRFRIADLKGVGDWSMFKGIAEVLIEGPTDDHVAAATEMVEWGVAEMERRLQAPPGSTFDPVILLVDEAQVAFMCPAKDDLGIPYGGTKATSRYFNAARKIHNQGRAVDVLLWQGTQDPTDQNLPKLVREGAHIRACLAVGTESQAKMALGENPVIGGAAPHMLRQDLDKGTLVANGDGMQLAPGQTSITVRTHYVSTEEAFQVAERIKARRGQAAEADDGQDRDLLDDLYVVVGEVAEDERIRVADLPAALRRLAPDWPPYETLTGLQVRDVIVAEYGVRVTNSQNVLRVEAAEIRRAWARREAGE